MSNGSSLFTGSISKSPIPLKDSFDFIFCRNVMIYFDKKTQEELVNRMAGFLGPGAIFVSATPKA